MRTLIIIILIYIAPLVGKSQIEIKPEWIEKDIEILKHFFDNFPPDPETTVDELIANLESFKDSAYEPIGFNGFLYWWILPGGTITINSHIVIFQNRIAIAETIIYKDDIKGLNRILKKDSQFKDKFLKYFTLQVNPKYFNDSVYIHTFINDSILKKYKKNVAKHLGKQKELNLSQFAFEYNLLNKPTGRYYFDQSYFNSITDYPPVMATKALVEHNKLDCLFNIVKGYSLPGRMYGVTGILKLVQQNRYKLTSSDKELLNKVLKLDLRVKGGYDWIIDINYENCIDKELLKLIE